AQLRLVLGLHALGHPGLTFHIKATVQHPRYKPAPALENDLALLQGDSGGPIVCGKDQVLAGVLSFSSRVCTDIFRPPVATAVAPYVSWIRKVTG
ncbi:Granzyme M, partial [Macaca fascicularis]